MNSPVRIWIFLILSLFSAPAHAEVVCWDDIAPGVNWCAKTLTPPGSSASVTVHWAVVDLTEPSLYIRVTRDTEGPLTTSQAAALLNSSVTINGDWTDTVWDRPLGLSVGNGWQWPGSHDWDGSEGPIPGDWSFLACDSLKDCRFNPPFTYETHLPTEINVIGGNGARLVVDGVLQNPAYDSNRRPRSAVCLDQSGTTMRMYASEGECVSCNIGFTTWDWAEFVYDHGCWTGMMLDGGGSTDLVLLGTRVGDRPEGEPNERVTENHLSIIHNTQTDPECATVMNGRFCVGDILHDCQGGTLFEGDCSFFGATCEENFGTAYCVHPFCTNGGNSDVCLDDQIMARCSYGQLTEFNCNNLFGASCANHEGGALCLMIGCDEGPESSWCDGSTSKTCAPVDETEPWVSLLEETDCAALGFVCDANSGLCADPDVDNDGHDAIAFGGQDCDDNDPNVAPNKAEHCDLIDEDCDGSTDEEAVDATLYYVDGDNDSFGDPEQTELACAQPAQTSTNGDDCDDADPSSHPGAEEIANDGIDQDCDGDDLVIAPSDTGATPDTSSPSDATGAPDDTAAPDDTGAPDVNPTDLSTPTPDTTAPQDVASVLDTAGSTEPDAAPDATNSFSPEGVISRTDTGAPASSGSGGCVANTEHANDTIHWIFLILICLFTSYRRQKVCPHD